MVDHGYSKTTSNHYVLMKRFSDDDFIILLLYIDDMLIVGHVSSLTIKDLGPVKQILGMRITYDRKNGRLWLSQKRYIEKVLKRLQMSDSKPVNSPLRGHSRLSFKQCLTNEEEKGEIQKILYASVVSSLMYAIVCTRSDIAHIIGVVSRFNSL